MSWYVVVCTGFYIPSVRSAYTGEEMRPEIPDHLVRMMESEPENLELDHLYQVGGYQNKGEFIRAAVREKIGESKEIDRGSGE